MEIAQFETVHLILELTKGFDKKMINIPFDCDEVILKYGAFTNASSDGAFFNILHSNLVNRNVLFSFPKTDIFFETLNTPFHCNSRIQGEYYFNVTDILGKPVTLTSFNICLVIVFIRY
jgi:hypothetical protein